MPSIAPAIHSLLMAVRSI